MQQHSWSGRLGLQVRDPLGPEQSFSAAFHLQGNPEQGRLDIFNPLGSQIAQLQWHPGGALLIQGDRYTPSQSLQELLRQSLGTALPVQALFSWLRDQPATASHPAYHPAIARITLCTAAGGAPSCAFPC